MKGLAASLTAFSAARPKTIIALTVVLTALFALALPRLTIDTDPKHMLPETSPVRVFNDQVERDFALHADVIVVGIVNEHGVFNPVTLTRIAELTRRIQELPGVVTADVISLSTLDNVTARAGELTTRPVLERVPETPEELVALRALVLENPLFVNRIISPDATTTAILVPIAPTANGKKIADAIRGLLPALPGDDRSDRGSVAGAGDGAGATDRFHLAGDPVARDTFGAEMFRQMGLFSPIAGLVMAVALWFMFRNVALVAANMAVSMVSIVWSMGLFIALGYPVHIMSSMAPIFLMAIATDSVHVFNEFAFRWGETRDRSRAIRETMAAVAAPVFFSDLTTAVGFAALATATIIPVKIFGLMVGFGTCVILLMSFTLVPAILALLRESGLPRLEPVRDREERGAGRSRLERLGALAVNRAGVIALIGLALLAVSGLGLARIRINNNMVNWFVPASPVRTADRIMNAALGGTSTAYLVVDGGAEDAIKNPELLTGLMALQRELERDPLVGKTFSVVDFVKRINLVLHDNQTAFDRVPDSREEVGQYLFLFGASAKPRDLDNVVDYPFRHANIFLQLKSWDANAMQSVLRHVEDYLAAHPLPGGATIRPAGVAYFNQVWSDEVLWGMLESFFWGTVMVLGLLVIQMRSFRWGVLTFLPLLFTIALIYGAVGFLGKDFDMPVAVLSTLSLGMAVDFAIHFVDRFRRHRREEPRLRAAIIWTVARPGRGILLNAILFAIGFAVMVFADLTPYITVGVLMAAIMLLSAVVSILYLPGLIRLFSRGETS